jgi:hypothetical protein
MSMAPHSTGTRLVVALVALGALAVARAFGAPAAPAGIKAGFADTGIQLANELKPGPVPEFPRITAPGQPWRYGNVPPEVN